MKSLRRTVLASCMVAICGGAAAQASKIQVCRSAEESLAEVSVQLVAAFNSMDFDKAKEFSKKADDLMDKGVEAAKDCGCDGVRGATLATKAIVKQALENNDFADVQVKLQESIFKSEEARGAAEACWRKVAVAAAGPKDGGKK